MFLAIVLMSSGVACAVYLYVIRKYSFWARLGVPHLKPHFPFGTLKMTGQRDHYSLQFAQAYNELKKCDSPFGGIYLGCRPFALITDLKFAQRILIKDFEHFGERGIFYNEQSDPLTANLFNLHATKWRPLRMKLSPTFSSGKIKFMCPTVERVGDELVNSMSNMLANGRDVEIHNLMGRYTTDVIGTCAFGIDCNSLRDHNTEFYQMGRRALDKSNFSFLGRFLMSECASLARLLRLQLIVPDVTAFYFRCVTETVNYREQNDVHREDFMELLIKMKNTKSANGGDGLTIAEIAAQSFIFFVASLETSSVTLTFALYELAQTKSQHIQDNARTEINQVLAKHNGQLTYDALIAMQYVDQIIKETLRKYPPIASLVRVVTKEYKCVETNTVFPEGIGINIPTYGIHHDPDIYYEPEEFRPERFSVEESQKRPHGSYLPFGAGPRNCIAMRFGMMQTRVGLVMLLRNFRFSTCSRTPAMPIKFASKKVLLLAPAEDVVLDITKLKN